jgi:hypothetical protein
MKSTWRIKAALAKHPEGLAIAQLSALAFISHSRCLRYLRHFNKSTANTPRLVYIVRRVVENHAVTPIWALGTRGNAPKRKSMTNAERHKLYRAKMKAKLAKDDEARDVFMAREKARHALFRMRHWKEKQIHPFMFKPREEQMQG